MIYSLFLKEIRQTTLFSKKGIKLLLSIMSSIILLSLFILLEVYFYSAIFEKVDVYKNFNTTLFIFIEFAIFIIGIVTSTLFFQKSLYKNQKDRFILGLAPVSNHDIIFAKSSVIFLRLLVFSFSSFYVFALTYGYKSQQDNLFYVLSFFGTLFFTLLILFIGSIISIPCNEAMWYLKKYKIISFCIVFCLMILVSLVYTYILQLFVNLIRNNDIGSIFTIDSIEFLNYIGKYLYPTTLIINFSLLSNPNLDILIIVLLILGFGVISYLLLNRYLNFYYKNRIYSPTSKKVNNISFKITTTNRSLINKEVLLALNNNEGVFSFISLIVMQPFFVFSVVSAINLIFDTGNLTYISTLFPSLYIAVDTLLILLFLTIINSSSSLSLKKEKDTLIIMKNIPVSYFKQIIIKIIVPSVITFISYFLGITLLVSFLQIDIWMYFYLIFVGIGLIITLNILSLLNELRYYKNSNFTSILLSFVFPIVTSSIGFVMTLTVDAYYQVHMFYCAMVLLNLLILVFILFKFKSRVTKLFINFEGFKI